MMASEIKVCVIGLGELGTRIAGELSLNYGLRVHVFDNDKLKMKDVNYQITQQKEELIRNGLISPVDSYGDVETFETLQEALIDVDFVFEAIVDRLDVKQWLYEKITHNCKSDTVVCSNTLQLNLEDIAESCLFKNRVIGCRFLVPVYRIPLVEMMYTSMTSIDIVRKVKTFFQRIEKQVVVRQPDEKPRILTLKESREFWEEAKEKVRRDQLIQNTIASHGSFLTPATILNTDNSPCKYDHESVDENSLEQHSDTSLSKCDQGAILKQPGTDVVNEATVSNDDHRETETHVVIETQQKEKLVQDKPKEEDDEILGDDIPNECVLCNDARINCVLVPCGHMWLCYQCGMTVLKADNGCPACRKPIMKVMRVYLP
eukprot:TCONS_00047889-protein